MLKTQYGDGGFYPNSNMKTQSNTFNEFPEEMNLDLGQIDLGNILSNTSVLPQPIANPNMQQLPQGFSDRQINNQRSQYGESFLPNPINVGKY